LSTAAAGHVAGAEHQVGVGGRVEQGGQVLGGVRSVGVHLDDELVVALQRAGEPGQVGGAEPVLARPVQHADARVRGGHLVGQLAGAVGARVVDDEHLGVGYGGVQTRQHRPEVLPLLVRRDHHQHRPELSHPRPFLPCALSCLS
jgi:hypothetical protein